MHDAHEFLNNLALVLCVAAVSAVVLQRLKQPVVLGYIIAGLLVGPHLRTAASALPVADRETIQTLSELGVILVMFSLGLEFSVRKLLRKGLGVGIVALVEVSLMMWLGFVTARLFHWNTAEAVLTAAAVAISSTTIIAKTFEEQKVKGPIRDLVYGVLIFEDLIAIVLLATLPTVVMGQGTTVGSVAGTTGRLLIFLLLLLVVGMLIVPRLMRAVVRQNRDETTLVASIGLCFAFAVLVRSFGYSVALGAFLAGSLVAESGTAHRVATLIRPVRDVFAAIFFVSVGMLIEPTLIAANWVPVLVLTVLVVGGKVISVFLAAFLAGNGMRTSVRSAMSMAQIGEFSFILAGMGLALGVAGSFLFAVIVAVSFLTTLLTPWLIRISKPAAEHIHERLPASLQTLTALYGTWIETLRAPSQQPITRARRIRRRFFLLILDAVLLAAIVIGVSLGLLPLAHRLEPVFAVPEHTARILVIVGACLVGLPFLLGIVRQARGLGLALAELALPTVGEGQLDLAIAPRRAFIVTLQLLVVLAVGAPLIAVTQPFLPPFQGAAVFFLGLILMGVSFWRTAENLQGHVRAGAQVIVEVLAAQGAGSHEPGHEHHEDLSALSASLPGLGTPVPAHIEEGSSAVGQTLAQLNLPGHTGATVLAITRAGGSVLVPTGTEALRAGDVLALAGTSASVEAAKRLLAERPPSA